MIAIPIGDVTAQTPAASRPLRYLHMQTGEVLHVEWLGSDARGVEFRWHENYRVRLPRNQIASIGLFPGTVLACDEDFEQVIWSSRGDAHRGIGALRAGSAAWSRRWDSPIEAGWCRVWWRVPQLGGSMLRLNFRNDRTVTVTADERGLIAVDWSPGVKPDVRQPIRSPREWSPLVVIWNAEECQLGLSDGIIARTRYPLGGLTAVELLPGSPPSEDAFDDLVVMRTGLEELAADRQPATKDHDALQLVTGDEWFGTCESSDPHRVVFRSEAGRVTMPWTDIRRITFRTPDRQVIRGTNGWLLGSDAQHQPPDLREQLAVTRWGWSSQSVDIHPWLGPLPRSLSRQFRFTNRTE